MDKIDSTERTISDTHTVDWPTDESGRTLPIDFDELRDAWDRRSGPEHIRRNWQHEGIADVSDSSNPSPVSPTRVIHVHEMAQFPDAVYIGRAMPRKSLKASPLANPFKIGRDGDRETVLWKYNELMTQRIVVEGNREFIEAVIACRNRPIACWCRRSDEVLTDENGCHGDYIVSELANFTDDELRRCIAKAA